MEWWLPSHVISSAPQSPPQSLLLEENKNSPAFVTMKCSFHRCIKKVVAVLQEDFSSSWPKGAAWLSVHLFAVMSPLCS